jgi:hypothetical protein
VVERGRWSAVALPSEHGGWGLTLEPVLLGLLLARSWAGLAIGGAAFVAFLVRTPLKLALVDARRGRWLSRSALALRIAIAELVVLVVLALASVVLGGARWLVPLACALPLVLVQLGFDVRSHGRRLVPELCGASAMAAVAAAIVVAGGGSMRLGASASMLLVARTVGAIPFVRAQIQRMRHGSGAVRHADVAQVAAVAIAVAAGLVDRRLWCGVAGVVAIGVAQSIWVRRLPTAAKVLGLRQMALGLVLVAVAVVGKGVLQ